MGGAEATTPPAHLKARILAAAERTPQQPPRPAAAQEDAPDAVPDELAARRTGSSRRRWSAWLAGAAAALVIVTGGIVGLQAMQEDEPELAPAVSQVFGADDARTATVGTENGGKLTVGVSPSRNEMAVDTRDLPELDDDHVYQLWAVHGDEVISVGILQDLGDGASMGMPEEDTEVAVTVEPEGGSEQPTSDPIAVFDLTEAT
jgi:anti-sigma-K factor RskA